MNMNSELSELVNHLLKNNVKVYYVDIPDKKKITYIHFTKNNKIGYAQVDRFNGISFSTVHKPCQECGTGFQIDSRLVEEYKQAFYAPSWAMSFKFVPYDSWENFIENSYFKDCYVELTEEDLK